MLLNAVLLISLCVQCLHIAGAVSNEGARAQRETRSVETEGQGGPLYTALLPAPSCPCRNLCRGGCYCCYA
ncbi:hypothetical protein V1264_016423 [Littorina saxatilis]|uniref:Uncharacterized protein n=1 Tax=Littorina saxatilis TaxID=31220 RepID=A0AAN9BNG9_9CAEN